LAEADGERVERGRLRAPLRTQVGRDQRRAPEHLRDRHRPHAPQPALDRALEGEADQRRRQERQRLEVRIAKHPSPQCQRQRRGGPGVQGHLERLARVGGQVGVVPAEQPRHQRQVTRARHGQQLGRALEEAQ
jgi:hypothetical protein